MASNLIVDVDRFTGDLISGWPRVEQSIFVILSTRLNTRLMRLWWGSDYINIIDKPMNEEVFSLGIISAIDAVNRYEPEFNVTSVQLTPNADGSCRCIMTGVYVPELSNKTVNVTIAAS